MAEGVKADMKGFSFLYADPTDTALLYEYRKGLDGLIDLAREAKQNTSRDPFSAFVYAMARTGSEYHSMVVTSQLPRVNFGN